MPRIAVVDLGTNSTRLLIADVQDGAVDELVRETEVTRLGEGVDSRGRLSDTAMDRVFKALERYRALIDGHSADRIEVVATSAVRDAANGEDFRAEMSERFGFDTRIITGDEEARLTFRGATSTRTGTHEQTLVIDIGGGSTEFVIGRAAEEPDFHVSTQSGSVRQTERHLHDDPPTAEQLDGLRIEVAEIIGTSVPEPVRGRVERAIAVAGTATQLAAVDQRLDPYDPDKVDGYILAREACERMLEELASKPLEERRTTTVGLHPDRAPTIVAGAAILCEAIRAFGLGQVETSEADILHGVALDAGETGDKG